MTEKNIWDWLKEKCNDCYKLNMDRTIHKDWNSYKINLCPKHQKDYDELRSIIQRGKFHGL